MEKHAEAVAWSPGSNHDDGLATLLQTETILPDQYFDAQVQDERSEPERRLLLAVLEDALITLLQHSGRASAASQRLVVETQSWIASDRRESPFDFAALCDILDLEVEYVRSLVQQLRRQTGPAPMRRRAHAGRGHHKVRDVSRRRRRAHPA